MEQADKKSTPNDKMRSNSLVSLMSEDLLLLEQPIDVHEHLQHCDSRTTFVNLIKLAFGTGLLALPYGMEVAGLFPSILCMIVVAGFNFYSVLLLVRCFDYTPKIHRENTVSSMSAIARHAFGKYGVIVIEVFIMILCIGAGVSYLIFIEKTLSDVYSIPQWAWVVISMLPLSILVCLNDLSRLSFVNITSFFFLTLSFFVVLSYGSSVNNFHIPRDKWSNWSEANVMFSYITFSFTYPGIFFPVYEQFKAPTEEGAREANAALLNENANHLSYGGTSSSNESRRTALNTNEDLAGESKEFVDTYKAKHFFRILFYAITLGILINGVLSVASMGLYHDSGIKESILDNLPKNSVYATIVRICFSLVIFLSYPIAVFFPNSMMSQYVGLLFTENTSFKRFAQSAIRIFVLFISGVIAICIPSFAVMIEVMGACSVTSISYIIPPLLYMKIFWNKTSVVHKCILVTYFVSSCAIMVYCTYNALKKAMK